MELMDMNEEREAKLLREIDIMGELLRVVAARVGLFSGREAGETFESNRVSEILASFRELHELQTERKKPESMLDAFVKAGLSGPTAQEAEKWVLEKYEPSQRRRKKIDEALAAGAQHFLNGGPIGTRNAIRMAIEEGEITPQDMASIFEKHILNAFNLPYEDGDE